MKKTVRIISIIIVVLVFLAISTGIIDFFRVTKAEKPIFIIASSDMKKDGGSGKYYGLGYQIEIKGNFMPEDPIPGIKYVQYSILGIPIKEIHFE